jgi:uncharacterized protein (TIGR02246 family)
MEKTPENTVQDQVDAYNARDLEAFLDTYAEDAVLSELPGGREIASGREAMRPVYASLFEKTPDLHAGIENRIVQGNFVVDHEAVTGFPGHDVHRAVAIYHVRDGRIDRVWFLRD